MNSASRRSFKLIPWFLGLSLASIALVGIVTSILLVRFLTERMLRQDAEVTRGFVQSIVQVQLRHGHSAGDLAADRNFQEFFNHVASMPDVIRANVFDTNKRIIWSSTRDLIGRRFDDNSELDSALSGGTEIKSGMVSEHQRIKKEHQDFGHASPQFVEIYMPLRDPRTGSITAVLEIYRIPTALFDAVNAGTRLIWGGALFAGLFLYATLFWIVRRASHLITSQQEQLVEAETLGALGEMATAVAHGIRNPLASIRSSAELWHEDRTAQGREAAQDIMSEVDRLEKWVRELLTYSQAQHDQIEAVDLREVLAESLKYFERETQSGKVQVSVAHIDHMPRVRGDASLIGQVFNSLITNAIEAMRSGGQISITGQIAADLKHVVVRIGDTGVGIPADRLDRISQPFYTTKPRGTGVGLALVRRILKRLGGSMAIESRLGKGTVVTVNFLVAA